MHTATSRHLLLALAATAMLSTPVMAKEGSPQARIDPENFAKLAPQQQERVLAIVSRWEAIAQMDRSALERSDRKALRAEVKALKAEAKAINQGGTVIYLSSAAIIIIILLLILIL